MHTFKPHRLAKAMQPLASQHAGLLALGTALHLDSVLDQLADDGSGSLAGKQAKVHGGLGVAPPLAHATGPGPQGEHVSRPPDAVRPRGGVGQRAAGERAVVGADARRHGRVGAVDRDGVGGAAKVFVVRHHLREAEVEGARRRDGRADQTRAVPDHEGHLLRRYILRRDDQVGLVLTARVVEDNDELAISYGAKAVRRKSPPFRRSAKSGQREGGCRLRNALIVSGIESELRQFDCGAWHVEIGQEREAVDVFAVVRTFVWPIK